VVGDVTVNRYRQSLLSSAGQSAPTNETAALSAETRNDVSYRIQPPPGWRRRSTGLRAGERDGFGGIETPADGASNRDEALGPTV